MSTEDNKALVRRAYDLMNNGDLEVMRTLVSATTLHINGVATTFDEWMQGRHGFLQAFPDMRVTLEEMIAEGDWVADRHTIEATHMGEFQGIPPSGRRITYNALELLHFMDGQLVAAWDIADFSSLMRQLSATAPPQPPVAPMPSPKD